VFGKFEVVMWCSVEERLHMTVGYFMRAVAVM
jgi:hypothetical protein